jgi:pilus assembly protein CpaE
MKSSFNNRIRVLTTSRSSDVLTGFEQLLSGQPDIQFSSRHIVNGTADPLHAVHELPDLLLMDLSHDWQRQLAELSARPISERPPIIAVGDAGDARMMREAMQAGARDFFTHPCPADELLASVHHLVEEKRHAGAGGTAHLTAVINAKGGSGASFIASNLAHLMAADLEKQTALIDLDLQFGTLPLYLDLTSRTTLMDALAVADELDGVALEGHMTKHHSGLHLLPSMSDHLGLPWEIPEASLNRILNLACHSYQQVVVDLPRQIDPLTSSVIEHADTVLLVMQQNLTHIRDAKRLLQLFSNELGVPCEAIEVVVNRYSEKSAISLHDVRQTLKHGELITVPNDFRRVSDSVNAGQPLFENCKGAPITRTLQRVAQRLAGTAEPSRNNVLHRAVSYLFT